MDERVFSLPLVLILSMGGVGVYLMLPRRQHDENSRRVGGGLAGVSLLLVMLIYGAPAEWWPPSLLSSTLSFAVFLVLALIVLLSAVMVLASREALSSAYWFLAMLAGCAGLYLLISSYVLSLLTLMSAAAGLAAIKVFRLDRFESAAANRDEGGSYEPALACMAGVVLTIAIIGTVRYGLVVEAHRSTASRHFSALPLPMQMPRSSDGGPITDAARATERLRPDEKGFLSTVWHRYRVALIAASALMLVSVAGAVTVILPTPDDATRSHSRRSANSS